MERSAGRSATLELKDITKRFSDQVVIGPVSLNVAPGEFFSLLGPSGCGKTTILRCIAGFEHPTSGSILLNGERLDTRPPYERDLGIVFQSHTLFPHLSTAANVGFGLRLRKVAKAEAARRVEWALALVGLTGYESRMPSQLSGGQQQRVSLARSLVLQPPLLLLDEPLSSLDLKLRQQMRQELRALQINLGQTTIFVTHDQSEALALSDRLAVMSGGQLIQVGSPTEIYRAPSSKFVASFIGEANLLSATVLADGADGRVSIRLPNGVVIEARAGSGPMGIGAPAVALMRPENLRFQPLNGNPAGEVAFDGEIQSREYLGSSTIYTVNVAGIGPVQILTNDGGGGWAPANGENVRVSIRPDEIVAIPDVQR